MRISVNGKEENANSSTTVLDFLKSRGFDPALVSVEHNGRILEKEDWPEEALNDGDELEILFFMGGGV